VTVTDEQLDLLPIIVEQFALSDEDVRDIQAGLRELAALRKAHAAIQREHERAFQILDAYGVTRERAKSVGNGIDVLATRLSREVDALQREHAASAALRDLLYDTYTVWQAVTKREDRYTSADNVSDTLDALNRAWKAALAQPDAARPAGERE
jgi:hypothetical protein